MRIKANHLTILRIVLLPIPYFLIFQGTWQRISALVLIAILGFTDYFDGILARKYGTTALGKLLDPIADKIFVAVLFLPLVKLKILPLWLIWLIFLREFIVTELRRFTGEGTKVLSVTELAKIKTTLQMTGGGLILLTATFTSKLILECFLAIFFIIACILIVIRYLKYRILSKKLLIFLGFIIFAMLIRYLFDIRYTCLIYGLIILIITLASGLQYIIVSLPLCLQHGYYTLFSLLLSVTMPLAILAVLSYIPDCLNIILLILCIEFGVQGLDLLALHKGGIDLSWIKKYIILPIMLILFLMFLYWKANFVLALKYTVYSVAIIIVVYGILDIYFNRKLFNLEL